MSVVVEAGFAPAVRRPAGDEALRARTGVDPARLDADDAPWPCSVAAAIPISETISCVGQPRDRRRCARIGQRAVMSHLGPERRPAARRCCARSSRRSPRRAAPRRTRPRRSPRRTPPGTATCARPFWPRGRSTVHSISAAITVSASPRRMRIAFCTPVTPARERAELDGRRGGLHVRRDVADRPCPERSTGYFPRVGIQRSGASPIRRSRRSRDGGRRAPTRRPSGAAATAPVLELLAARLAGRAVGDRVLLEIDPAQRVCRSVGRARRNDRGSGRRPCRPYRPPAARAPRSDRPRSPPRARPLSSAETSVESLNGESFASQRSRSRARDRSPRSPAGRGATGAVAAARAQDLGESVRPEPERLGAEVGELGLERLGREAARPPPASSCRPR